MSDKSTTDDDRYAAFHVSRKQHRWTKRVCGRPHRWIRLGNLESKLLAKKFRHIKIDRPIYLAGLARAGSTILLEIVASHPQVTTHQYKDFPFLFTPYWWNGFLGFAPEQKAEPVERAHADRLMVTPESPEAMEEVLWMAFFPQAHDPERSQVLDATTEQPAFDHFYRDHIRKLLAVRGGARYAAKGNYNVSRLEYLLRLFPDARFVIPVRRPRDHVASLRKQHRLFCEGERRYPRSLDHMRWVGHYEFGLDRRPINVGNGDEVAAIQKLWDDGQEVRGWARYWSSIYAFVARRLEANEELRRAATVVRYEDLCQDPHGVIGRVFEHCGLPDEVAVRESFAGRIEPPDYYRADFTAEEDSAITEETAEVAGLFGYRGMDVVEHAPALV